MPRKLINLLVVFSSFIGIFNISYSQPVVNSEGPYIYSRDNSILHNPYNYEPIIINNSTSSPGIFNSGMIFIAEQLQRNINPELITRQTIIATFSDVNNFSESSQFGRMVSESLMHELQIRNWNVVDVRLTKELIINEAGEFSLSRDVNRLRASNPTSNMVTGSYSVTPDGVILNVRILDVKTGTIISTAQTRLVRDRFIASMVDKPETVPIVYFSK
jgi:TolB-like protein